MALDPTNLANFDLLTNLQGNILKGHGRDHSTNIFIHFDKKKIAQAKKWINKFADETITSAQEQLRQREVFKRNGIPGALFAGLYISASGYVALGLTPPPDPSFNAGMKSDLTKTKLNDPDKSTWDTGYNTDIHAMILLADDDEDEMGRFAKQLINEIDKKFSSILHIEYGNAIRNENGDGIEHFGYVDGASQPLFLQDEVDDFKKGKALPLSWDPEATLDLVLVDDTLAADDTAKGSYFVFRKLEQQVKAFNEAKEILATELNLTGDDKERAGAMIVGRFNDGTPVTMNKQAGIIGSGAENNFNYDNDTLGAKCPFHAHIRKTNPRGTGLHETLENEKKRRMARRAIPYGFRNVNTRTVPSIPQMPDNGVGLLFMCFQANLANQFEFIQSKWANNVDFPATGNGSDPIFGQGSLSKGKFATKYDDAATLTQQSFNSFVTLKGGEYFFAPSLKFLRTLS